MCGLSRPCDILTANELKPDYVGFVFASGSKRHVSAQLAARLKCLLDPAIKAVGVFVNESPEIVAQLLDHDTIDAAQLHGNEDEAYIATLRKLTDKPIIKAFRIASADDMRLVDRCSADYVLLDSGAGIKQYVISTAPIHQAHVVCGGDPKSFDNWFVGEFSQCCDIGFVFVSVELSRIDCVVIEQLGHDFRAFVDKNPDGFDCRVKQALQASCQLRTDMPFAAGGKYKAYVIWFELICGKNVARTT